MIKAQLRHQLHILRTIVTSALLLIGVSYCAVSPVTQAKMDEFARTIPSCSSDNDCSVKWAAARSWIEQSSDYPIQGDSDTRIYASNMIISHSGVGVVVNLVAANGSGNYQIVADMECFSANNCPELWDKMVDFNRTVNRAQ
ncbi:MAG: hypothetical protein COA96_08360 [SAR86 cluster bacterium]|uniref:Uncharacterized protein n=1 Tax=SAR86 cluster bacterium TaxID=2030880 RepID=A0A2A5B0K4_9GAMM|nr:MAG: hypothetical protein COA96_08360 [SAR86 cluster bacterium]